MIPSNYIDPGTAGLVFTSLGAVIIGVLSAIAAFLGTYFFRPIRRFFRRLFSSFRKRPISNIKLLFLIAIVIVSVLAVSSILMGDYVMTTEKKILIIGIDAMDAKLTEKMMAAGELPNFKHLADAGGYSRMLVTIPPETPVSWSAAATGMNPGGYGIFDFVGRDTETYLPKLKLAEMKSGILGVSYESALKGKTFWKITSDEGIPTTVIKWPVTFPAEEVEGRMLSGLGVVDLKGLLNSYSYYTTEDIEIKGNEVGKMVKVEEKKGEIETSVFGPNVRQGGEVVESTIPMKIKVYDKYALIDAGGKSQRVNEGGWSEWFHVTFSLDFMQKVDGIFKVYVISTKPFRMYMTTVQMDPENPVFDISYPKDYSRKLAEEIGTFYTMGMPEDTKAVTEGRITKDIFYEQVLQIEEEREKMFWHEFERFESGVLAVGFDSGDRLKHIFWNGTESPPREITDYYKYKDDFLGRVLDKLDGRTKLIIFSDHGFNVFNRSVNINTWLVENGYMALRKDITEGDVGELFKYVDWSRTKAYSLGFSSIFINLEGREGRGIVKEADKAALEDEIAHKLKLLQDNGKKVITNVYGRDDIYAGPYVEEAPDLVVGFEPGYRMSWESAVGGVTPGILDDNDSEWIGDHLIDRSHVLAVVFANFEVKRQNPEVTDIAPTVLDLLGTKIPGNMDGKSLVV
jgi:predicted AlkP superfamily phosphohydrolase/phosphomutase